jgi:Na+/melibiose symporter-like transporter
MRDRGQEASSALKWFRGSQYDPAEEIAELQNDYEEQKQNNLSIREALGRKSSVRGLVICLGLMFFQQVSGINAVIFFTTDIFVAAGTDIKPDIATIIVGVMQVVATFVASLIVDRLGRRILLLASDAVMALCTLLLGIYFFMKSNDKDSVSSLSWLPIVSLCLFIVAFSIGFGPVPWLMIGELFASDVRTIAAPLAGTLNWFLGEFPSSF